MRTCSTLAPCAFLATSSRRCWPAGRRLALLNSNSTSVERSTFSITTGAGAGAAATGAGGGGGVTATGATGSAARATASQGGTALSGVQSLVFQHWPAALVPAPLGPDVTYPRTATAAPA